MASMALEIPEPFDANWLVGKKVHTGSWTIEEVLCSWKQDNYITRAIVRISGQPASVDEYFRRKNPSTAEQFPTANNEVCYFPGISYVEGCLISNPKYLS